jgi:hypothetical protein
MNHEDSLKNIYLQHNVSFQLGVVLVFVFEKLNKILCCWRPGSKLSRPGGMVFFYNKHIYYIITTTVLHKGPRKKTKLQLSLLEDSNSSDGDGEGGTVSEGS